MLSIPPHLTRCRQVSRIKVVVTASVSVSDAARQFAESLAPQKHLEGQEAMRFARWFGDERPVSDIKPSDIETYVDTFGATAPNAAARADALKAFLGYAHKHKLMPARLVSHVRVRRPAARGKGMGASGAPEVRITEEGRVALTAELDTLKARRPEIAEELRLAAADKDFRENAPLDAARDAQGQLEARIRDLEGKLRYAVVVDDAASADGSDRARIGSSVVLSNLATGNELSYQIVNAAESRQGSGRLSVESPVGQAVVGHRAGEVIEVAAPSGALRFKIERVGS